MSDIRPFRGFRPPPHLASKVAAPPYDVLNSEEAREMAAGNPMCFLRISKSEIDLDPTLDSHSDVVYQKGHENLREFIANGWLVQDAQSSYYIYQQTMNGHTQTGLIVGASAQEYEDGLIKKHEHTRRVKEDDRARHVDMLNANAGPVFLTYRARKDIDALVDQQMRREPDVRFTAPDGVEHVLWPVSDPDTVAAITQAFAQVDALYVADGHHRSAAAYRVRNLRRERNPEHNGSEAYNHFLSVLFPDEQLAIMGYYRAVQDLNGLTPEQFLAVIGEKFEVVKGGDPMPAELHKFTMYLDGEWYGLTARPGTYEPDHPVNSLDVSILQTNLLDPILGIKDPRTDDRIDFIGGIRGTKELERRCKRDMRVAFALYPVSVGQLMAIADTGNVMPPKSTWFEPKLRSGMVVRSLGD